MTIEELENAQEAKTLPQKKQSKMRVRITDDLALLIETYYKNVELSSEIISKLFNTECTSTIAKLKKMARKQMAVDQIMPWNAVDVNTACAYKAWGMNIKDLEERYAKLQRFHRKSEQ